MNLLQTALDTIETLLTDNTSEDAQAAATDARIKLTNAMTVEPYGWLAHGLSHLEIGKYAEDNARSDAKRMGYGAYAFPLYLHPPQQAKPKTMGDVQEMCIAALQREERGELANKLRDIGYPECCDAADMLEADASLINEGNKAQQAKQDTARLDWLEQNLFNRENLTLQGKVCKDYNMWVIFSPVGVQGSARTIIDAAMKEGKP